MPMLCLPIPEDIQKELSKISVPGDKLDSKGYHITLFYFQTSKIDDLTKILEVTYNFLRKEKSFSIKMKKVSTFENSKDKIPIIIEIDSDSLQDLRARLAKKLDAAGIEYSKNYPTYRPHCTLSYAPKKHKDFEKDLPTPLGVKLTNVSYYAGHDTEGLLIRIPFGAKCAYKEDLLDDLIKLSSVI